MRRLPNALFPVLLMALVVSCAPERKEREGELRIISLSPSITGILVALGAGPDIVGVDRYSLQVEGAQHLPSLGGLFAPDLERTIELAPTLALGVASEQQTAFFQQLRARGVAVHQVSPFTLEEVFESYRQIGGWVGRDAEPLVARVRAELDEVRRSVADRKPRSVAVVVERDPLYVVAGGTFVNELIAAAGGMNVFADLDRGYPQVSIELLAERKPEVLIDSAVATLDEATLADARAHWQRFRWTRRVEFIAQGVATLPGAQLADGARVLRDRIHPEN